MESKLFVGNGILAIRFDESSFFNGILGFNRNWDYRHYFESIVQKFVNLSSTNKTHLKCDVIDGSVVDGLRQPVLFSFVMDEPSG